MTRAEIHESSSDQIWAGKEKKIQIKETSTEEYRVCEKFRSRDLHSNLNGVSIFVRLDSHFKIRRYGHRYTINIASNVGIFNEYIFKKKL